MCVAFCFFFLECISFKVLFLVSAALQNVRSVLSRGVLAAVFIHL